jgi:hypothetical protein
MQCGAGRIDGHTHDALTHTLYTHTNARAQRRTHLHARSHAELRMYDTGGRAHFAGRTHTRMHEQRTRTGVDGCTLCVMWAYLRMHVRKHAHTHARAHTPTRKAPEIRQTHARSAGTLAGACAHTRPRSTAQFTNTLAGSQIRTHMYTRTRKHTHARTHTRARARAQTHTHTRARAHAHTRTDGARCGVCASAIRRRWTPLLEAAYKGHVAVAVALLAHGADVNAKSSSGCGGRSLFRAAVGARCGVCVSAFRRRGTSLLEAAYNGHAAVVAALLAHGADVHAKDKYRCGGRSLFLAAVGARRTVAPTTNRAHLHADTNTQTHAHTHTHTHTHTHARTHTQKHTRTHAHTGQYRAVLINKQADTQSSGTQANNHTHTEARSLVLTSVRTCSHTQT